MLYYKESYGIARYCTRSSVIFINDLESSVQFSQVMIYADDTVIYYSSPQPSEIGLKFNLDLFALNQWLHSHKLIVNEKKTEFMIFDDASK